MTPADQFAALADPTRCRLLEMLRERPQPVHRLAAAFDISRPAISRHLRVLREADLVDESLKGRERLYHLRPARLRDANAWLGQLVARPAATAAAGQAGQLDLQF